MARLAIIPARIGSKRIPKKNTKLFFGKPIIQYSIETALQSGLFDEVMVSTDHQEIKEIATQAGASVPFLRSTKNADDFATLSDVVKEVLFQYKQQGVFFDTVCCLLPTAPFITVAKLKKTFDLLENSAYDSVFPIVSFSYPIQRALEMNDKGMVKMVQEEFLSTRSQDLPERYFDAGQFYWMRTQAFLEQEAFFMKNTGSIVISETEAQDIDTPLDWEIAEMKYKLMNTSSSKK